MELPAGCTRVAGAAEVARADAVVLFVANRAALDAVGQPVVDAAVEDRLAWVAYPKGGRLGTDLNRDVLAGLMAARGAQPVRQVGIDEVWSALRFRPA